MSKDAPLLSHALTDSFCPCGNINGTNEECERCVLIAEIVSLRAFFAEQGIVRSRVKFYEPKVETIREYCLSRRNGIDPEKFHDYYAAQGWKLANGQAMRDWKAAVRNWERGPSKVETKNEPHIPLLGSQNERR